MWKWSIEKGSNFNSRVIGHFFKYRDAEKDLLMERNLFEFWRIEFINVIGRNAYFDKFQAIILY